MAVINSAVDVNADHLSLLDYLCAKKVSEYNLAARDDGCIKLGRRVGHQLQRKTAIKWSKQHQYSVGQRW